MRMILALATSVLFAHVAAAAEDIANVQDRLAAFERVVKDAAKENKTYAPFVVAVESMRDGSDVPAQTFWIPTVDGKRHVIHVKKSFLQHARDTLLEHVARHEVCHAVLDHPGNFIDVDRKEFEAERCVYRALG